MKKPLDNLEGLFHVYLTIYALICFVSDSLCIKAYKRLVCFGLIIGMYTYKIVNNQINKER